MEKAEKNHSWLEEIQVLYGFAIILVVVGHALVFMNDYQLVPVFFRFLYDLIYIFHMPLFFAVAGYLFVYTNRSCEFRYGVFVLKKAKKLIIPYLLISSIVFLPKAVLNSYALRPVNFSMAGYVRSLLYSGESPILNYWFLPVLFIVYSIFALSGRSIEIYRKPIMVALLSIALFSCNIIRPLRPVHIFYISDVCSYLIYFWIGCMLYFFRDRKLGIRYSFWLWAVLLIAGACLYEVTRNQMVKFIGALVGILFSFSLAEIIVGNARKILRWFGKYVFQIYLLSWFFETGIRIVLYQMLGINYYIVMALTIVVGLFVPIFLTVLLNRCAPAFVTMIGFSEKSV